MTRASRQKRAVRIIVRNRQRKIQVNSPALQDFAESAISACLKLPGRKREVLSQLDEVSVAFVSDRRIADLHCRFLNERGPTDVITFQHGEIVVSAETAQRQARAFRTSLEHELRLYIAHGLLHLRGYDDETPAGAAEMKRLQENLVAKSPVGRDGFPSRPIFCRAVGSPPKIVRRLGKASLP